MRYFLLPIEGLSEDMRAALARGLGLSTDDAEACRRHCLRYGMADPSAFLDELGEAQAALATARALGATVQVDDRGRLCYDVPPAPGGRGGETDGAPWNCDAWLTALLHTKGT